MSTKKQTPAEETMALLWARIAKRGDLPGFSKAVGAIIGAMRGDDDREFNMTKTVLSDPALTQKVLRLANSAMYSVFGQEINTVSKAVIVLGTEAIGHLALGLKLIDGLSASSGASADARLEMEKAVLAGHIARQIAASATTRDAEEAVVCAMLHSLGRILVAFYLPDRWQILQKKYLEDTEEAAEREALGLPLEEVGRLAAQRWGLPASLVSTLENIGARPTSDPLTHTDWLASVATLSSSCATAVCVLEEGAGERRIRELAEAYAGILDVDVEEVVAAVDGGQKCAAQESWVVVRRTPRAEAEKRALQRSAGKPGGAAAALMRGAGELRAALETDSAGQLLTMALETVYQSLGLCRAVAFLRDQEEAQYVARMGFGPDVQELLPRLVFEDAYQPDVFHTALASGRIIFVEQARDPGFTNKVPRWWKAAMTSARSFLVLPLKLNRIPIGFIYGDWDLSQPPARIEAAELLALHELRELVQRALEQHRRLEPSWARRMR